MAHSAKLLVWIDRRHVAMFRFLLEGYPNLAIATTLERQTALLKLLYARESEAAVIAMLADIDRTAPLKWRAWPGGDNHER